MRGYAGEITAVASVADDGGSTGRLRRDFGVPAPGDLRKCLVALAGDAPVWPEAFEHRFAAGDLEGHALGNLMIVGLTETLGDFCQALDEAGRLLDAVGRVLPATTDPVVLKADVEGEAVEGQVAVQNSAGRIRRVGLIPNDAPALRRRARRDRARPTRSSWRPGSLYTSLLPVLCVPELREALAGAARPGGPGLQPAAAGARDQRARRRRPPPGGAGARGPGRPVPLPARRGPGGRRGRDPGARASSRSPAAVARPDGLAHDPLKLAEALQALL